MISDRLMLALTDVSSAAVHLELAVQDIAAVACLLGGSRAVAPKGLATSIDDDLDTCRRLLVCLQADQRAEMLAQQ
jgi:hypothetical protein